MSKMWERADFWPTERGNVPLVDDDYARGVAEARRTVETELAAEREALLQLAGSIEAVQSPSSVLIAGLIVAAVERLVIDIAGNAPIDSELLRERADALAAVVSDEGEAVLAVHPDDAHLLHGALAIIADPAVPRGTVQARSATSLHEDGVAPALDRLRAEMTRLGLAT